MALRRAGAAGYPAFSVETRHLKAALPVQINRTETNDAGADRADDTHSPLSSGPWEDRRGEKVRMSLTACMFLQSDISVAENNPRCLLHNSGLKVGDAARSV